MLFTLAAVVFFAAIFVFFSQEFVRIFKKIFAIKGATLILPLAAASTIVFNFNDWVLWGIYYYHDALHAMVACLTRIVPFAQLSSYPATILSLTLFSVGPVFLLDWYFQKKIFKPYPYPYLTGTLIWLVSSFTLIML